MKIDELLTFCVLIFSQPCAAARLQRVLLLHRHIGSTAAYVCATRTASTV